MRHHIFLFLLLNIVIAQLPNHFPNNSIVNLNWIAQVANSAKARYVQLNFVIPEMSEISFTAVKSISMMFVEPYVRFYTGKLISDNFIFMDATLQEGLNTQLRANFSKISNQEELIRLKKRWQFNFTKHFLLKVVHFKKFNISWLDFFRISKFSCLFQH